MSKKIFYSIWSVAIIVFLASLVFILGVTYTYFSEVQRNQLRVETQLASQGVALNGMDYFENLDSNGYRITWIDSNGLILYDNEAISKNMENHMEREEVKAAFEHGYGESSRYSQTLSVKLFYSAQLLSDGTVLRLSSVHSSIWTLILGMGQPIAIVALITLFISLFLASRLSKKIVEPINQIDPDNPANYLGIEEYKEVELLLRKMSAQQAVIRRNQDELETNSLIRQEFTANASHELKTPLHAISGYAELIEYGMVKPEDVQPFAEKIRLEAQRMTRLVEDIINLTKLDSEENEMQWDQVDLYQIAQNAVGSVQSAVDKMSISLTLSGKETMMYGVPQVLYSIIYNLLDNAIKYNHPNGLIEVTILSHDGSIELKVKDTGIGIPIESQSRIFERFYRVDKSHSREIGGTGLGLSIVKHGLIIHNAKITVESELNIGTTFTVIFPKK